MCALVMIHHLVAGGRLTKEINLAYVMQTDGNVEYGNVVFKTENNKYMSVLNLTVLLTGP